LLQNIKLEKQIIMYWEWVNTS